MAYQATAYYLIVRKGPNPGAVHPVGGNIITLGRQPDNHIVISDHRVSRHHARLSWRGAAYSLEDLGSGNGTWVNNTRIAAPVTLRPGDIIGISEDVLLLFSDQPDTGDVTYHVPAGGMAPAAGPLPPTRPPVAPAPMPPVSGRSQGWTAFSIGGLIALVGVLLLAFVAAMLLLLNRSSAPGATPTTNAATVVAAAATPTSGPFPTPTSPPSLATSTPPSLATLMPAPLATLTPFLTPAPYPTYTPYPTPAPTFTPYPTFTPTSTTMPTSALAPTDTPPPTLTPYPTYTPYPAPAPTVTPYPT